MKKKKKTYRLPPFGLFKKEAKVDFVIDITACSCKSSANAIVSASTSNVHTYDAGLRNVRNTIEIHYFFLR